MGHFVSLTASDGRVLDAYLATPSGTPKGGLVVGQEIFGVNGHIRRLSDRFAAEGYLTIAPALFDRFQKRVELGYSENDFKVGHAIWEKVTDEMFLADIDAAARRVSSAGKVGLIGYCFGGYIAWAAACALDSIACAIGYYGGRVATTRSRVPKCPVQLHFADNDAYIPLTNVGLIREAHPEIPLYVYDDTRHGFCCDDREEDYNAAACQRATARSLEFLKAHVG
jgi:carboxymethylenebutenolidase